jgi:hypothetical protein
MTAPGKQAARALRAAVMLARFGRWLPGAARGRPHEAPAQPSAGDRRFSDAAWTMFPFNALTQAHLLWEEWCLEAVRNVPGLIRHHETEMDFMMRQLIDVFAPSNIPWMNPVVLQRTAREGGGNLLRGMTHWLEDRSDRRQAARRHRGISDRSRCGYHSRQGGFPQRPDGSDPVRGCDGLRPRRTDPDCPGADHGAAATWLLQELTLLRVPRHRPEGLIHAEASLLALAGVGGTSAFARLANVNRKARQVVARNH